MSTVFYAWQSNLPSACNLDLIESALEDASRRLREDKGLDWHPTIDRDTKGVPGAPDIPSSIFAKIEAADVSVFDVSIAVRCDAQRPCPNPNVMLELGYALKAHPLDRLLLVFNKAFGSTRELPFDIGHKRLIIYSAAEGVDLDSVRASLAAELFDRLREAQQAPKRANRSEVQRLMAVLHDKVIEMLSSRGGVILWANRDAPSGYVVLTPQNRHHRHPQRDLRSVVRYDAGQFRLMPSAYPEEIMALEQLTAQRGMQLLQSIA